MTQGNAQAVIRNIAEVPWKEYPNHFGGALSKPLVTPETAGARHLDYRISMYQPMAYVELHKHKVQEQVYHVLDGEGLMEIGGKTHVVRKHDVIYPAAGRRALDLQLGAGRPRVPGRHLAADGRLRRSRIPAIANLGRDVARSRAQVRG